ncbi:MULTISPECIES: hypothetical protein [unclassified Streptomyces]|uniref:hypothetical protein n=1 Tax=unclassified Streptomyces TaxID=2593676 RepID=UPI000938AE27|nr:hypothetical protein [Streptomyces sp. TSRI0281]OKI34975.1 hypothetical protein A6A29_16245 [Streptomyces sp. TSRI0281]
MTLSLTIHCDRSGPTSTCARFLPTGTDDEAAAYVYAAHQGWDVRGGVRGDFCPAHAHRSTFAAEPARILHTRTEPT